MFVLEQINIDVEKTNTKYDAKLSVGIKFFVWNFIPLLLYSFQINFSQHGTVFNTVINFFNHTFNAQVC